MFHIEREIAEQPDVIRNLLSDGRENVQKIVMSIREFNPAYIMIAARGTSDNAARYAQYLIGIQAKMPVALATPSIHTLYDSSPNLSRALVIGISQSGQSEDVRKVLADANEQGGLTLSITNTPDSPLAQLTRFHLPLNCGEELSVAATKTYTAQLAALALLITELIGNEEMRTALEKLPGWVSETLRLSENIANWAQRYRYIERIATLGRGYNYCTAFEIGLKIKELCYISGDEYSEADFRHGPIAIIQRGFPVMVVAPEGKPLPLMIDLLEKLNEREAEALVISNNGEAAAKSQYMMPLPSQLPEWLSPICSVLPGQIFAMHLALLKGHSVDRPQGLTKVTNTQ